MSSFLLEIGAEELPVAFLASAPSELATSLEKLLADVGVPLSPENIQTFAAPRRLAWWIQNLPHETQPKTERLKGPPLRVALDEQSGQPTPAGLGFAQKMKVSFESLEQADGYLWVTQTTPGQSLSDLLTAQLPSVITSLSGAHFMRWQADPQEGIKFSRPIRWLTALWDDRPLTFSVAGITSDRVTRGLRLIPGDLALLHADDYLDVLRDQGKIEPDDATRRESIEKQLHDAARSAGGSLVSNDDLLTMVTRMNESATVFTGRFDEKFLQLPACVLTTVLASHQKLFAVKNAQTEALLPVFLGVSNNPNPEAQATIAAGNERVVRARFQDAQFFFETDRKHSLEHYAQKLDGVTFQKNLGTMKDKTERLVKLSEVTARQLWVGGAQCPADYENLHRAALFAKADLVTLLVREFTELQGVIGAEYAQCQELPEPKVICDAIALQYHPRFAGDSIPNRQQHVALAMNLADKLDTLVAIFAQKDIKPPSGSKDPLGLRRIAIGMLEIIYQNQLVFPVTPLLSSAFTYLKAQGFYQRPETETLSGLKDFIEQRAKFWLSDTKNISSDIIESLWAVQNHPLDGWTYLVIRANALASFREKNPESLSKIIEGALRVEKILLNLNQELKPVDTTLFNSNYEENLYREIEHHRSSINLKRGLKANDLFALQTLTDPIHDFFDNVLVNAEDPAVKANRLALLQAVHDLYCQVARFSLIQV